MKSQKITSVNQATKGGKRRVGDLPVKVKHYNDLRDDLEGLLSSASGDSDGQYIYFNNRNSRIGERGGSIVFDQLISGGSWEGGEGVGWQSLGSFSAP